jgi:uncharacterized membrane protein
VILSGFIFTKVFVTAVIFVYYLNTYKNICQLTSNSLAYIHNIVHKIFIYHPNLIFVLYIVCVRIYSTSLLVCTIYIRF